jgi:hypothetical protein
VSKERAEIYRMKDFSHEEQMKHIMSVSAAYPPGIKPPFDWFGFWLYVVLTFAALGAVAIVAGSIWLLS